MTVPNIQVQVSNTTILESNTFYLTQRGYIISIVAFKHNYVSCCRGIEKYSLEHV